MDSPNILHRPIFWYSFIGLIILVLFLYGTKINQDKTELQLTKQSLAERNKELEECKAENLNNSNKIDVLTSEISKQNLNIEEQATKISQNNTTISELQSKINDLKNRPPQIVTKYKDRTVYKNTPERYHPYGKGMCKVVVYTTCPDGGQTSIYIDDEYAGYLDKYFAKSASCNSSGTVAKILLAGKHKLHGKDKANRTWTSWVTIKEDDCYTFAFTCQ